MGGRLKAFSQVCIKSRFFFWFLFCQSPRAVGVWVGGLSDMLVRKFPPLAELLEKGVRAIALEKVTGGSCSSASDEKAFKSARIQNSEQRQDKRGEPSTLHYPLSGYVCIWGKPPPTPARGIRDPSLLSSNILQPREGPWQRCRHANTLTSLAFPGAPTLPMLAARVSPLSPLPATRTSQLHNLPEIRV